MMTHVLFNHLNVQTITAFRLFSTTAASLLYDCRNKWKCYSNLLCFDSNIDAKATLQDYASRHRDFLQTQGFADGYMMSDIASKMVQTCCERNDFDRSLELLDLLFESGYVKSGAFNLLSQLVNSYVNKYEMII